MYEIGSTKRRIIQSKCFPYRSLKLHITLELQGPRTDSETADSTRIASVMPAYIDHVEATGVAHFSTADVGANEIYER